MEKTLEEFKDFMHTEEMGWQDFFEWHLRDEEFRKIFEWLTENKSGGDNG